MSNFGTYDSKRVDVSIGLSTVFGFGEGSKVVISRSENMNDFIIGVDGDIMGNRLNNVSGTMSITLLNSSPWNNILAEWDSLTDQDPDNMWLPVTVRIPSSKMMLVATGALMTQPDVNLGTTAEDREWVFFLSSVKPDVMGTIDNAVNLAKAVF